MPPIHHALRPGDHAAVSSIRALAASAGERAFTPEAREAFDAMGARTPPAAGVTYEAAVVGGIAGWWCIPSRPAGEGVILHHHGGAYVLGSAAAFRHAVGQLAARARMPAFTADYALAPERPYPAATSDALAAYKGLVALGHRRIALAGDSAGGGLTLALLAMTSASDAVPRPLGALVVSPWTDLALTGASMGTRAGVDPFLTARALRDAAGLYLRDHSRCAPGASPLYDDLVGLSPVQIHVGEDEILLDDSLRYAERATRAGIRAEVHVWAGMPHVFTSNVGAVAAAGAALDAGAAFLRGLAPPAARPDPRRPRARDRTRWSALAAPPTIDDVSGPLRS